MSQEKKALAWKVEYSSSAKRQKKKLPKPVTAQLANLAWDLEHYGPKQPEWSHYRPLKRGPNISEDSHHCHIKNGRPTYVVCWQVIDKTIKIIEIFYVGTHENTPY